MFFAQNVEKWILQELAFVAHDILRVESGNSDDSLILLQSKHLFWKMGIN